MINIGQRMGVVVDNVDTELNRIDFTFEDEFEHMPSRKPGRSGFGKLPSGGKRTSAGKPGRKGKTGSSGKFSGRKKSFGGRSGRSGGRGRK